MAREQRPKWHEAFAELETFAVRRPFTISGREFKAGEDFDSSLVNTRKLRQMYESRFIDSYFEAPTAEPKTRHRLQPRVNEIEFASRENGFKYGLKKDDDGQPARSNRR